MEDAAEKTCPRCDSRSIKNWRELTDEQKMLVDRLPFSAEYADAERKKHRYCTRCWFEDDGRRERTA